MATFNLFVSSYSSMLRKLIFIAMLAGVSSARVVHAQQPIHIVRGQVLDAQTGESLPSANIRIEGTFRGTITNADGVFEIAIEETPAELVFRYIGYESQRYAIPDRSVEQIEIRMQPTTYQMPELVVTGENPAIGIMRCVIDRKQERRALLSSYASEAYTRFTVANDTGIVGIIETLSDVFWDKEQGMRELIKSRRQTTNLSADLTSDLEGILLMANLYDDDIPLLEFNFMGVTHPDALDTYRFSLQGTRLMDDRLVYDITVAPKSRLSTAFAGEISVLADECALLEVALEPGEAFLLPRPFSHRGMTLYQQYDSFDGSAWLPVDYRAEFGLDVSFGPLLYFPTFKAKQLSRITDYEIEATLPDSLYAEGKRLGIDQEAIAADTLLDRAGIAVPLEEPERVAYAGLDSTMTLEKAFEPKGILARRVIRMGDSENRDGKRTGVLARISEPIPGLRSRFRFNRAEGFAPGAAVKIERGRLNLEGHGRWSHGRWNHKLGQPWTYGIRGSIGLGPEKRKTLGVSYFDGIENRWGGETGYSEVISLPTISSLFGIGNYYDHFHNQRISAFGRYRKERFSIGLSASREMPAPVEAITAYDLFAQPGAPRPNPPVSERRLHSVTLTGSYSFSHITDSILPRFMRRGASFGIEYGKLEGMEDAYVRLSGNISGNFDTFFSRRPRPNTLTIDLRGGARFGELPIHRFGAIHGSIGIVRLPNSLHTLAGRPYEGDRYVGFFWEQNFRTIPFELLGLHGLARRGYGIIVGGGHAQTWISPSPLVEQPDLHLSPDGMHHELTVSLDGILGFLRVNFARRLDRSGHSVGIGIGGSIL